MHKGCKIYLTLALNKKGVAKGQEHLSMVRDFVEVFPEKLPGMLPERELEFTIDLKPRIEPLERNPYWMLTQDL
jgi:hypothetical protein